MWSGPRNISTAMMYAFGNRADFTVWDEPFYGAYLAETGVDHPMRAEVLSACETDAGRVSQQICEFQGNVVLKLMTFHMCDGFPLDWAVDCVHIHLLRHPARVVASYMAKRENPDMRDIGFAHQAELFRRFPGPVVESAVLRADPEQVLRALCSEIGLDFDPAMLAWPAGPKPFDGVWAAHWYDAVHRSEGFAGPEGDLPELEGGALELADAAMPFYDELRRSALS